MTNVARGKKIQEQSWKEPELLTNGEISGYTGNAGFAYTQWPETMTLDLENIFDLYVIRFLLWDGMGKGGIRDTRRYKYRLSTSEDLKKWDVHYDTMDNGFNGWQSFHFQSAVKARYIEIHCLHNSANALFHIVEVEAYDNEDIPSLMTESTLDYYISNLKEPSYIKVETSSIEVDDFESNLEPNIKQLLFLLDEAEELVRKYLNQNEFSEFLSYISKIRLKINDVYAIEQNVSSIRRQILNPINQNIRKLNKWSILFGVAGLIIGLLSLIASIFVF